MKSIIEDFAAIKVRLDEIAQEKQPKPEEPKEQVSWGSVYGFTPGVEDVYCAYVDVEVLKPAKPLSDADAKMLRAQWELYRSDPVRGFLI